MGDRLIEYLIWGILLLFTVKGFLKGLVREVCSLLGLVVGGWAAFRFSPSLAVMMKPLLPLPHGVSTVLAFILILIASGILAWLVGHLLTAVFKLVLLGGINRIGGSALGLLEGALLLCMLLTLGSGPSAPKTLKQKVEASASAHPFVTCGRELLAGWRHSRHDEPGQSSAAKETKW
jgi:membrane protein required for colicin V production